MPASSAVHQRADATTAPPAAAAAAAGLRGEAASRIGMYFLLSVVLVQHMRCTHSSAVTDLIISPLLFIGARQGLNTVAPALRTTSGEMAALRTFRP